MALIAKLIELTKSKIAFLYSSSFLTESFVLSALAIALLNAAAVSNIGNEAACPLEAHGFPVKASPKPENNSPTINIAFKFPIVAARNKSIGSSSSQGAKIPGSPAAVYWKTTGNKL